MTERTRTYPYSLSSAWTIAALTLACVVLVGLYSPVIHEPYLSDDYQWVFAHPAEMLGRAFTSVVSPENRWYRPLQAAAMAAVQVNDGLETWPIRALALLSHAVFAGFVYQSLLEARLPRASAVVGSIFFLISQIAAIVLVGNDMLSQLWSGLFSFLTLAALAKTRLSGSRGYYVLSLLSYVMALLSKESSSTLILGVAAVIWFVTSTPTRRLWDIVRLGAPYAAIVLLFLLWRNHLGALPPHFGGDGMYDFRLGGNVLKNAALFGAQSVLTVSSLEVMRGVYTRDAIVLVLAGLLTLCFAGLLVFGLLRSSRKKLILVLCVLAVIGVTPSIFLNHVSESYLYNSLPYLGGLVAIAAEYYAGQHQRMRITALGIGLIVLLTNCAADYTKSRAIRAQADRAEALLPQVIGLVHSAKDSSTVFLVHPSPQEFEYSVFQYRGFRAIEWAEPFILRNAVRPDVTIRQIDRATLDSLDQPGGLAVTYDPHLRVIPLTR